MSYSLPFHRNVDLIQIEARGISLRFPRFIRIRDDKDPDDASNAEFVSVFFFGENFQECLRILMLICSPLHPVMNRSLKLINDKL